MLRPKRYPSSSRAFTWRVSQETPLIPFTRIFAFVAGENADQCAPARLPPESVSPCATARIIALILTLSVACSPPPSAADREKLGALERQYGQKFQFELEGELYVRVVSRDTAPPPQQEMENVYRAFMFDQSGTRRRTTTFVYLNVYDGRGDFRYQLAFDPKTNEFVVSKTEHY